MSPWHVTSTLDQRAQAPHPHSGTLCPVPNHVAYLGIAQAKRVQRKAQETAELGPDLVPEPGPSRSALGLIKAASSRSRRAQPLVRPAPAATAATAGPLPSLLARPKRKALLTPGKSENTSADGLDIFVDDEFQPGGAGTAPLAFGREPSAPSGLWTKLGSAEVTRKENTQQPASWVGQTLAQKKKLVPALAPALDIPVDEDLADQGSPDRDASAPEVCPKRLPTCTCSYGSIYNAKSPPAAWQLRLR